MFLVGGGILVHGMPALASPRRGCRGASCLRFDEVAAFVANLLVGIVPGGFLVGAVAAGRRAWQRVGATRRIARMTQDELKQAVAREAIKYVVDDAWIGVGSGTTANFFIDELGKIKNRIKGAVSSSEKSTARLKSHGIEVEELNNVDNVPVYIDGADEVTKWGAMIKGGGGALTREKIVAAVGRKFVCIVDQSKVVDVLGRFRCRSR